MSTSSSTAPPRQAGKGLQRRAEIIEAARERLIERGALVLRDIANELGITHGNLQYYFPTKNELIKAIFDEEVERFTSAMHESMQSSSDASDTISRIVDSNMAVLARRETRLWRILFGMADQEPYLAQVLKQENERFESVLESELKVVAPHLDDERLRSVARIIRLISDGIGIEFIYTDATGPSVKTLAEDVKRTLRQMLSI